MRRGPVFIVGGARSGKSAFALSLASSLPCSRKLFVATAEATDDEMAARVAAHRLERGEGWETVEEPVDVVKALEGPGPGAAVVVDCLTLWLSNLMHAGLSDEAIKGEIEALASFSAATPSTVITVSNEVGLGIVPENAVARRFRDLSGWMNQRMASVAAEAYFVASGIPMRLK